MYSSYIVTMPLDQCGKNTDDSTLENTNDFVITASDEAQRFVNPLRKIVDGKQKPRNPDKELLNLSLGNI